jgi:hypothetical protein
VPFCGVSLQPSFLSLLGAAPANAAVLVLDAALHTAERGSPSAFEREHKPFFDHGGIYTAGLAMHTAFSSLDRVLAG